MNPSTPKDRYVLPETMILAGIGCLDLLSTLYLIATNRAHEANPFFAQLLQNYGPGGFVLFKALMLGGPLTVAEIARKHKPEFVRTALRIGIILYSFLYVLAYLRNNFRSV